MCGTHSGLAAVELRRKSLRLACGSICLLCAGFGAVLFYSSSMMRDPDPRARPVARADDGHLDDRLFGLGSAGSTLDRKGG